MKNNYVLFFILFITTLLHSQTVQLEDHWWVPNSTVRCIVKEGNTVYLGGDFTSFGPNVPYGASISTATALPDEAFARPNGAVSVTVPDGVGGWYIGGSFTAVSGETRNRIARINSDGSLHPWNPDANNTVLTIAVNGTTVYVGGNFTSIGGQARNYIAELDATTGIPTTWSPNASSSIYALAVNGTTVYAGGNFLAIGGQTRHRIAALDATTGLATAWNPNASGTYLLTLAVEGSTVYAGGDFNFIGGQTRNYIAALDATTGLATAWNPNASGPTGTAVYTLAVQGATVYAGGYFTDIGGQARNRIAALDATTGVATAWNPNASSYVRTLVVNGTTVYAGGEFTSIGGQARSYIAALDVTTGIATTWNPKASSFVNALALNGTAVYAGGNFVTMGGQTRNRIAALDATTGQLTAWNPDANSSVYTLAVEGATVYAGGTFTTIGGQTRNRIAALDATTGFATAWNPIANSGVYTLAVEGSTVYAGGNFLAIGGQTRYYIAALDATTGFATAWNPNANSAVYTLAVEGSTVYAGGTFTTIGGQTRNRIAALDATTGDATALDANVSGSTVLALAVNGSTVYAGGVFSNIGGQTRNYIAALDATTGLATAWNPNASSTITTIVIDGSTVYAGGNFTAIGGQLRNYIAALDATTGLAKQWNPNANSQVSSIFKDGEKIYVGGYFSLINGNARRAFAVVNSACTLEATVGTQTNVLCHGFATGAATVNVTGGTGAYTYLWAPSGGTAATATGLSAGTYTVTVTDANLCEATQSFTITEPTTALVATAGTQVDILCHGEATGEATVNVTGGTGAYTYSWAPSGGTAATATGLLAGTYTVTVTDANLCETTQSFTITEPTTALVATAGTQVDVLCYGFATGEATVSVTGGTGTYTYSWAPSGGTAATATGLAEGTYTVTVTDANLCETTQAFTITEPATAITATAGTQVDVLCYGFATGEATVSVTGGTGTYTYSWAPSGGTAATATGLAEGTYTVTVTDANLCETTQAFTITEPATAITATAGAQTNVLCHGNVTGAATVNVTGGTGTYTYSWAPSGGTAATATGLAEGTYTVTVTDANLCETTQSFTITEPTTALVATAGTQVDVLCYGFATGEATVNVTGGTGTHTYSWAPSGGTAATATGLLAGTYTVTVTDANLCETTQSFTITEPTTALVATAGTQVDILCYGFATGEATVSVTGGTGTYTYLWTPSGGTAATATGLAEGTYTVTVTDANLCETTQTFTITEPSELVATAGTQVDVLCHGNATGEATVNVTGGTGTYTYSWDTTPAQTTATATGLAEGTYTVTVTDANLCETTQTFTITEPTTALVATAGTQVDVLCHGFATGAATVNVTGGTGTYTYSWDTTPAQTTATATGLAEGTYTVTVTDANLCETTQTFIITEPTTALVATAGTQVDVLCHGFATGAATVNVTGGTGTYTYTWAPSGGTAATATGLIAGTYTVTVRDANLCETTQSFTITEPTTALVATAGTQVDVLCYGFATGEATVNVTGGTGAYTYSWAPSGGTAATATGLLAGTYTVTVRDANLCETTQSFTITEPTTALVATAGTQVDVLCYGFATGEATVSVTGGTGTYTYSWAPSGGTAATATGLAAGTYTVTVTDANLCETTQSFTITEPLQPLTLTPNTTQTNILCYGFATGTATVAVNGGTAPYSYLWNNGQTTNTIIGLTAGTYTVDVTDANGCILSHSYTITEPSALVASGTQVDVLCYGNTTGSATVNVTGGTGTYGYSWNTNPVQTTATATALTAGTYIVTVNDANQCITTQSFTITEPLQALSLTPNTSQINVSCFGGVNGSATIAINGGTAPYTYLWSNGQTAATATGLIAGTYTVDVTDANGCTLSNSFTITEPTALIATAGIQTNISCSGTANGTAAVNVTGGTGTYSYSWNTFPVQTTATAINLAPGTYIVTVKDTNLCQTTQSFTITQPNALVAAIGTQTDVLCFGAATGSATVNVTGGTPNYSYSWNTTPVQTTATATNLPAGTHIVTVTDANNCTATASVTITQPASALHLTTSKTNISCYAGNDGTAAVNATGGTGPYTYTWIPAVSTTNTATGLTVGNYKVVVTDANGCSDLRYLSIMSPSLLTGTINASNVNCNGAANGSAVVNVTGGTAPYTYAWSNGNTTASLINISGGTYSVIVTDAHNCTFMASTTITEPAAIVITSQPVDAATEVGEWAIYTVVAQNATKYQWQLSTNGGTTWVTVTNGGVSPFYSGATTPQLSVANIPITADGNLYRVIVSQNGNCPLISDEAGLAVTYPEVPPVTEVEEVRKESMTIYPNPASTDVYVKIADFEYFQNLKIAMYDLNGRMVKNEQKITSDNYRIDITGLESGVYVITIISDSGRMDKKIVINKRP